MAGRGIGVQRLYALHAARKGAALQILPPINEYLRFLFIFSCNYPKGSLQCWADIMMDIKNFME